VWLHGEASHAASPEQIAETMKAFTSFYRSNMLRRAFLTGLAMQLADQQIVDLHEQFLSMDEDGNGRISRKELANAITLQNPGHTIDVANWVESVFESVDTDGSDEIEYTEYLAAAHHEGEVRSDQAIHAAFRVFDVDCSGKISVEEICRITADAPADIAGLLAENDLNGDGEIDFEEFRDLILRAPPLFSPSVSTDSVGKLDSRGSRLSHGSRVSRGGRLDRPGRAPGSVIARLFEARWQRRPSESDATCQGLPAEGAAAKRDPLSPTWRDKAAHDVHRPQRMIMSI